MKSNFNFLILFGLILISFLTSCNGMKNKPAELVETTIKISKPIEEPSALYSDLHAIITHIETAQVTDITSDQIRDDMFITKLFEGNNSITLTGKMLVTDQFGVESLVDFTHTGEIIVDKSAPQITITPVYIKPTSGFVLEELYFNPSLTPEGQKFTYVEQYIKIRNNSDRILYADGLVIMESEFKTNNKQEYRPDIMATDMAVDAIAMIPGSGHDHPVQPGGFIIIANNAENHTLKNPNAVNLENADFEWYDVSSNPKFQDVDNPKVPNLTKIHAKTLTVHGFMQRGTTAIAIGKLPISIDNYLADYKYDYQYTFVFGDFVKEMKGNAYRFPNKWIIDAVNLGLTVEGHQWLVTDPSLDSGYTGWNESMTDKTASGKAARRKVHSTTSEGRSILKDTNNSAEDFDGKVDPSLKSN